MLLDRAEPSLYWLRLEARSRLLESPMRWSANDWRHAFNIVSPIRSVYRWEGAVQTDSEHLMIIKTRAKLVSKLEARVKELHSYEVPEVIAIPIVAARGRTSIGFSPRRSKRLAKPSSRDGLPARDDARNERVRGWLHWAAFFA